MKYTSEIIQLISWPVLIYISYRLSLWAVKKFEEISEPEKQ